MHDDTENADLIGVLRRHNRILRRVNKILRSTLQSSREYEDFLFVTVCNNGLVIEEEDNTPCDL